jgi:hypothetical protein
MFKTQLNTQTFQRSAQNYSVKITEFTVSTISGKMIIKLMVILLYFLGSAVGNVGTSLCDPCLELLLRRWQEKEKTLSITNPQKQSSKTCVYISPLRAQPLFTKRLYQPISYSSLGELLTHTYTDYPFIVTTDCVV